MKNYVLYAHDGSGNHGCEALVRTTAKLLGVPRERLVLVSERPEEDRRYGLEALCRLVKRGAGEEVSRFTPAFLKAYWQLRVHKNYWPVDRLKHLKAVGARRGDVGLSIGGDTYCYGFTGRLARDHAMWKYRGMKTVYWGCSIEPELLQDPQIAEDVRAFDLVTARESISYEALRKVNPNTVLVADSAFLLERKDVTLPEGLEGFDFVGINSSPLIEQSESVSGMARENYQHLIEYILRNTDMKVLLIPHVVWPAVDDQTVLKDLQEKYAASGRVFLIPDCGCEELKGYIARCRFFVGARTHATIAASSTGVPTLTVGYSVKSKGIAKDLFGTYDRYVLPVQSLKDPQELANSFCWLQENEQKIRQTLQDVLPSYIQRIYDGVEAVRKL